jgi:serine/threonine-protein kinase
MDLLPGTRLGFYEIAALLGAGGMGEVYRARDTRLGRDVAIKVLSSRVLDDANARRRFHQEALALSRLNHPHIETVYELGTHGERDYLVLEFVPGETLAQRLTRGPMSEREALELGAQIAEALEEAHECGVLHRDLKPGNIMVTPKGRAKVLDLGLARVLQPAGDTTQTEGLTALGQPAGTLAYMAPEQLLGHPVDARTDLYALGVTLYEITTGQRPFRSALGTALANEILHAPLIAPRAVRPELSPPFEAVILRCMERDPARRYQTVAELWGELRQLGIGLAPAAGEAPARRITSIAVLPLENLSGDPDQEYFADGMTEELIATLAQVRALRTISRTSMMRYKGVRKPVEEIARELNVDAVVEGSVRRAGDRVRITAQLVDARSDRHLWAQSYERDLRDVFALQGEVAQAIVAEIQVNVTPHEEARLRGARRVHPGAFEAYLKGRFHWDRRTEESMKRGLAHFQEAAGLDPAYALAHVGIADTYNLLGYYTHLRPEEAFPMAKAAAQRALELDAGCGEAHASLAYAVLYYDWDFVGAEREFRIAIEQAPHHLVAHLWYANVLIMTRRFEQAGAEIQIARSIDPLSMVSLTVGGWVQYHDRRFEEAVRQYRRVLELDPQFQLAHYWLGLSLIPLGRPAEAAAEFARCIEIGGRNPMTLGGAAYAAAAAGSTAEARAFLAEIEEMAGRRYVSAYYLAVILLALGERGRALEALERAQAERAHWLAFILVDPALAPLQGEARFEQVVKRVGVPT